VRILVVSVPSVGHARSMAPVARALVARGHDVHWAANESVAYVRASGAELHSVLPDDWTEDVQSPPGRSAAEIDEWFLEHWFVPIAERALRPTLDLAEKVDADLVVTDTTALWGAMVADAAGVPWASFSPGMFINSSERQMVIRAIQGPREPMAWSTAVEAPQSAYWELERRLNRLRHRAGLPGGHNLDWVSEALLLCFTTRALELDGAGLPEHARCVGPVFASRHDLDPFAGEEARPPPGDEPLVFLTLGRVNARMGHLADEALAALARLDVRTFVAATGGGRNGRAGPRVTEASEPISQGALLDRTAVLVGSGGYHTVNEALAHGVPVVVMPVAGDEPVLAARVEDLGLGISLDDAHRDAGAIRAAVETVLGDPGYRERARHFARDARLSDAVATSARLLERLGGDGHLQKGDHELLFDTLPTKPKIAARFALFDRDGGLGVASYTEDLEVGDPRAAAAVRWLWQAADGQTATTELLERWDGDVDLLPILGGLVRQGVLEEAVGTVRMDEESQDRYRDQITLFSHTHAGGPAPHVSLRGNEFQERLLAARVVVVGDGVLASNVVRHLSLTGVGGITVVGPNEPVERRDVDRGAWYPAERVGDARHAALAAQVAALREHVDFSTGSLPVGGRPLTGTHLVIVATDDFDPGRYAEVDDACQRDGIQWTSIRRNRITVEIGPTVVPGQSACFRCYELRRAANVPEETGMGRTHAGGFHVPAGPEWVALEAVKLLAGFGEASTIGTVVVFDPLRLKLSHHRVLRVPTCPRCRVDPSNPPEIPWMPLPEPGAPSRSSTT
jgi:bacteriocin biosynthesis cyclodehydratase domain-containing protein